MKPYKEMTREELLQEKAALEAKYKEFQDRGMKLDMSRESHPRHSLTFQRNDGRTEQQFRYGM